MATESPDQERLQKLVSKSETYAFVLDYALFGSQLASVDGGFSTQSQNIPNFQASLDELLAEGFIIMKTSYRYTGEGQYPEVFGDRDKVLEILSSFYEQLQTNLDFLRTKVAAQPEDFFRIYEHKEKIDFREDEPDGFESLCKELVQKGLMFSWDWVTRAHRYRCYKFREQPFNVLEEFTKIMAEKMRGYIKAKIDNYLKDGYASRLDFLSGLVQTRNTTDVVDYMKERGWSDKIVWEARNALEQERMLVHDSSSPQFRIIEDEINKISEEINELVQVTKPQELSKFRISLRKEGVLGRTKKWNSPTLLI